MNNYEEYTEEDLLWCSSCQERHGEFSFSKNTNTVNRKGRDYTCKESRYVDHQIRKLSQKTPRERAEVKRKALQTIAIVDGLNKEFKPDN